MTDKEELTRGEALARVAVLEAEVAELRKRVCVPEGWTREKPTVPGAYWVRGNGLPDALVVVKNDEGELWCNLHMSTTEQNFGYGFTIEQLDDRFEWLGPLAAAPAPVERLATDGGRNQRFEGLFEGETPDQRDARLASAAPVERVELMTWPQAVDRAARLIDEEQERLTAEGYFMDSDDCCDVLRESVGTPQPAPTAAQDVGRKVSLDVSTGDHDHAHRLFGEVIEVAADGTLLCELTEDNKDFEPSTDVAGLVEALQSIYDEDYQVGHDATDSEVSIARKQCIYRIRRKVKDALAELKADRDQQYDMKVKAREQRDVVTAENQRLRKALTRHVCTGMTDAQRTAELERYLSDGIAADKARIAELEKERDEWHRLFDSAGQLSKNACDDLNSAKSRIAELVLSLRTVVGMLHHRATTPLERQTIRIAETAIAQQGKE